MSNFFAAKKKLFAFLFLVAIALAIPLTVFFSQQQQEIRQRAEGKDVKLYFTNYGEDNTPLKDLSSVALNRNSYSFLSLWLDNPQEQPITGFDITIAGENLSITGNCTIDDANNYKLRWSFSKLVEYDKYGIANKGCHVAGVLKDPNEPPLTDKKIRLIYAMTVHNDLQQKTVSLKVTEAKITSLTNTKYLSVEEPSLSYKIETPTLSISPAQPAPSPTTTLSCKTNDWDSLSGKYKTCTDAKGKHSSCSSESSYVTWKCSNDNCVEDSVYSCLAGQICQAITEAKTGYVTEPVCKLIPAGQALVHIQGSHWDTNGIMQTRIGQTVTLKNMTTNEELVDSHYANWSFSIPPGKYTVTAAIPNGYSVSYSYSDSVATNDYKVIPYTSYILGNARTFTLPINKDFSNIFFRYTPVTSSPTPSPAPTSPPILTPIFTPTATKTPIPTPAKVDECANINSLWDNLLTAFNNGGTPTDKTPKAYLNKYGEVDILSIAKFLAVFKNNNCQ